MSARQNTYRGEINTEDALLAGVWSGDMAAAREWLIALAGRAAETLDEPYRSRYLVWLLDYLQRPQEQSLVAVLPPLALAYKATKYFAGSDPTTEDALRPRVRAAGERPAT